MVWNPMKPPTEEKTVEEVVNEDFKDLDSYLFCLLSIEEGKTFLKFNNGVKIEFNRQQMIETINQLSIGLMMGEDNG